MAPRDDAKRPRKGKGQFLFDWSQPGEADAIQQSAPKGEHNSASPAALTAPSPLDSAAPSESATPHEARQPAAAAPEPPRSSADEWSSKGHDPSHPWYYYHKGDNAPPVPFESIPANEEARRAMGADLPKSAAKRAIKAREFLAIERKELEQARPRYEDIVARGAEALSRYDREIAHGGDDDMARAGSLALLYNQISWRRGRIAALVQHEPRDISRSR